MEQVKHKKITQGLLEERAEQLLQAHIRATTLMSETRREKAEYFDSMALLSTIERQYRYGICGHLHEGEMLPDDFSMMEIFSALEQLYADYPFFAFDDNFMGLIETIKLAARARHELVIHDRISMKELFDLDDDFEHTSGEIELRELAAIADMSVQSVRNDVSKNAKSLKFRSGGGKHYTTVAEAKEWLSQRNSFKPTINFIELSKREKAENLLYVPEAKDGSYFSSKCRMTRGYQIGEKGNEHYFESFIEARDHLLFMTQAKWRRPNEKGNFGIVSATEWKFIPREEVLKN